MVTSRMSRRVWGHSKVVLRRCVWDYERPLPSYTTEGRGPQRDAGATGGAGQARPLVATSIYGHCFYSLLHSDYDVT